jgi:hypothetical protein
LTRPKKRRQNQTLDIEESIYNLIPPEQSSSTKNHNCRYRSNYSPLIIPTATTFCKRANQQLDVID